MKYVYRIFHNPTGYFYYGAKYSKDANPDTFWVDYFTSSSRIAELVEEYGADSFDTKIVKTGFKTNDDCLTYEGKLILKTFRNERSLNFRHSLSYCGVDEKSIEKMVNTRKENGSYKTGGQKRKQWVLENSSYEDITAKSAETKRANGFFDKLSEKVKENGIGYEHECPHCGKVVKGGNYTKWHGDNCKQNPDISDEQLKLREPWNKGKKLIKKMI